MTPTYRERPKLRRAIERYGWRLLDPQSTRSCPGGAFVLSADGLQTWVSENIIKQLCKQAQERVA